MNRVPSEANMGLGCGNPIAIAAIKEGETVLDLGSGGGFDCFLARAQVGKSGYVIGVDMTPDMIMLARKNLEKSGYTNMDFRLGEIEHLPVPDESVDVIISNCVINLSLDKEQVFRDAYRVLKNGGRLSISDVVATAEMPIDLKQDISMLMSCVAGAEHVDKIKLMLLGAGFKDIEMEPKANSRDIVSSWIPDKHIEDYVASYIIEARKMEGSDMKTLKIEWRHLDVQGETCDRCYDTGENLANEIKRLTRALQPRGYEVIYNETKLDDTQISDSNTILFNNVPIEDVINIKVTDNYCASCSELLGHDAYCRTIVFEGEEYDDIPAKAIRQAAYQALGIKEDKPEKPKSSGCCCGGGDNNCCC